MREWQSRSALAEKVQHPRAVLLHWRAPDPHSGDIRFLSIADALRERFDISVLVVSETRGDLDADWHFIHAEGLDVRSYERMLPGRGARRYAFPSSEVGALLEEINPQLVWLDHWHASAARKLWADVRARGCIVVFDWDLRSEYFRSGASWHARRGHLTRGLVMALQASSMRAYERSFLAGFTMCAVPTMTEATRLRALTGAPSAVVRNGLDGISNTTYPKPAYDFTFLGSGYRPNQEGVNWFLDRIWPGYRRRHPEATLALAGHGLAARTDAGVLLLGSVPDAAEFVASGRVFLSPVGWGSGSQNKLFLARSLGVPVVTDPFGGPALDGYPGTYLARRPGQWMGQMQRALEAGEVQPDGLTWDTRTDVLHLARDLIGPP